MLVEGTVLHGSTPNHFGSGPVEAEKAAPPKVIPTLGVRTHASTVDVLTSRSVRLA